MRDDLTCVDIDGEGLVHDGEIHTIHELNPLATLVFQLCDGKATLAETSAGIADAFGVPCERVQKDVEDTVDEFAKVGLLAGVERAPWYWPPGFEAPRPDERGLIRHHIEPGG
jgi:hypothetical protein